MSKADGWTPEAARAVVDRNGPTQGALRLSPSRTEAVKQQECVWWRSGQLDGGPCGRCLRCEAFRAPYDCPSDAVEKQEPKLGAEPEEPLQAIPKPTIEISQDRKPRLTPDTEGWYSLTISGEPQVWERAGVKVITPRGNACPKCGKSDRKPIAMHYTPEATEAHETLVAAAWTAAGGPFLSGRLEAELTFFQTPFKNGNLRGGDWDNFGKSISDALNNVAYPDDKYLRRVLVIKEVDEHNPRTVIRLRVMPE